MMNDGLLKAKEIVTTHLDLAKANLEHARSTRQHVDNIDACLASIQVKWTQAIIRDIDKAIVQHDRYLMKKDGQ